MMLVVQHMANVSLSDANKEISQKIVSQPSQIAIGISESWQGHVTRAS